VIYLLLAIAAPLAVASLVHQAGSSWLAAIVIASAALLVLSVIGVTFSYDCFNADCGGRDTVAGWGFFVALGGLGTCAVAAIFRARRRRDSRSPL
jgi:hypothetical protein